MLPSNLVCKPERTLIRISTAGCWNKAKFTFVPVLFSWLEIKKSHPRILAGFNQPKPANRPLFLPVTRFYWLPDFLCVPDSRPNRSRLILVSVSVFFFFFVSPSSETKANFFLCSEKCAKNIFATQLLCLQKNGTNPSDRLNGVSQTFNAGAIVWLVFDSLLGRNVSDYFVVQLNICTDSIFFIVFQYNRVTVFSWPQNLEC